MAMDTGARLAFTHHVFICLLKLKNPPCQPIRLFTMSITATRHLLLNPILATALLAAVLPAVTGAADLPPAHREALCSGCHGSGTSPGRTPTAVAGQCSVCHAAGLLSGADASMHRSSAGRCLDCHAFHEPSGVTAAAAGGSTFPRAQLDSAHCRACHDGRGSLENISDAHRVAAALYHGQPNRLASSSPSEACLGCHSNQAPTAWQTKTGGAVLAFNEHASHPYGVRVIPGSGDSSNWIARTIDRRLPLFSGRMECQTCHLLTAGTDDLLRPFPAKYDLCKGCHRHYGDQDTGRTSGLIAAIGR